jgi:hypothetical protein
MQITNGVNPSIDFPGGTVMQYLKRLSVSLLAAMLLSIFAMAQQDVISTIIGGGPNDMPAVDANLNSPDNVAFDSSGNYYISAYYQHVVFKVSTSGTLTIFAGNEVQGYAGDGGPATQAELYGPQGLAVDSSDNVYISDQNDCVIRKVTSKGVISTIAGTGSCGYSGDGGPGTQAQLNQPIDISLDAKGKNLFIADADNCRIRELELASPGTISTYAGTGSCSYGGDGGPPTSAELNVPQGVGVDSNDDVYIADTNNQRIREVKKNVINTIAGNGNYGYGGDAGPATEAEITHVYALSINTAGTVVTFPDYDNCRVRQFTIGGDINTVAGNGSCGYNGDNQPATQAELNAPQGIAVNSSGTFYVSDNNNYRVRDFKVGGNIATAAGNGSSSDSTIVNGVPPTGVTLSYPLGSFVDPSGDIYVADTNNEEIRESVKSSGVVNTFAGNGTRGWNGDDLPATEAELNTPQGLGLDSSGNVYIPDYDNCQLRIVNSKGIINNFSGALNSNGDPQCGFDGDGGPSTQAENGGPVGFALDSHGNAYFADYGNCVVREVSNGTISTVAGLPGECNYSGDGGPATAAMLDRPSNIAIDSSGNIFIADTNNCRIREVTAATGVINTIAGTNSCGFTGDGPGTEVDVNYPSGVWVDANDNLFIADTNNQRVRWLSPSGWLTTFAGNGNAGYTGDGIPALTAEFYYPVGITQDGSGDYIIADQYNQRVREVAAFAAASFSAENLSFGLTQVGQTSNPQGITLAALGPLTIASIQASGAFSQTNDCPASLTNGQTCTIYVYFSPTTSGENYGTITVYDNGFFNPQPTINLSGVGTAIQLSGAPISFPNTLVGNTAGPDTITIANTGSNAITMGTITLTETTDFTVSSNNCPASGKTLAGGASCKVGITFNPKSTGLKQSALVINDSDPSSPQLAGISGTGTSNVLLSPNAIGPCASGQTTGCFAVTPVGVDSTSQTITLINNTGKTLTLGKTALTVPTGFVINTKNTTCNNNLQIANNGNCAIQVQFKPTVVGFQQGTLQVADSDPSSPQTVALSGIGTAVDFNPASLNFGSITVGQCSSGTTSTISNVGPAPIQLTGSDIVGTNSADFRWIGNNCSGFPINIQPGGSCNFTYQFCPSESKKESATYEIYDNANGSPQTLPLTGTGQAAK